MSAADVDVIKHDIRLLLRTARAIERVSERAGEPSTGLWPWLRGISVVVTDLIAHLPTEFLPEEELRVPSQAEYDFIHEMLGALQDSDPE
ncbi:hypothetical protein ABZY93_22265 [Streptomyces smyrnaeus]|uniref:hypothetical protein n=1 Tax=Streptomyces smyrnaeus TaxID=1387713 RepID=UPI0033AA4182